MENIADFIPGDSLQEPHSLGASRAVLLGLFTVSVEPEGLPLFALGQNLLCFRYVLEIRNIFPAYQNGLQLFANCQPFGLDSGHPGK